MAIEGGPDADGDRHAIIVDRDSCTLYELFDLHPAWDAGSGAIWNLRTNQMRPLGWTSADAAGLAILPGLARYDEVARGVINHALRFTVKRSRRAFIYPARHFASSYTSPSLPPMGLRLRLRANFPVAGFPPQARVILRALKRYGMIVADNGSSWYISGPQTRAGRMTSCTLHRVKARTSASSHLQAPSLVPPDMPGSPRVRPWPGRRGGASRIHEPSRVDAGARAARAHVSLGHVRVDPGRGSLGRADAGELVGRELELGGGDVLLRCASEAVPG